MRRSSCSSVSAGPEPSTLPECFTWIRSFMPRRTLAKKIAAAALVAVSASRLAPPFSFALVMPRRSSSANTLRSVFGSIGLPLVGL